MKAPERPGEIRGEPRKRKGERGAPADHHIVAAGPKTRSGGKPHDLSQPSAHAVAFDGTAYLPRNGESDPRRAAVAAIAPLHHKACSRGAPATRRTDKVAAIL
jgi:hypothetical protein